MLKKNLLNKYKGANMSELLVQSTTYISIFIQLLTGVFSLGGVTYKLPYPHQILVEALKLELIVQAIEFVFYLWLIFRFSLKDMATTRYYDWFITTPTMLFTTIVVYTYLARTQEKQVKEWTLKEFVKENKNSIIIIVIANFFMLLFGYLGEIKAISKVNATLFGFISLAVSFTTIYKQFAYKLTEKDKWLFGLLVSFWSLYGVAYVFPDAPKNISYNFLDIIAKNFFGLYLFYKITQIDKTK